MAPPTPSPQTLVMLSVLPLAGLALACYYYYLNKDTKKKRKKNRSGSSNHHHKVTFSEKDEIIEDKDPAPLITSTEQERVTSPSSEQDPNNPVEETKDKVTPVLVGEVLNGGHEKGEESNLSLAVSAEDTDYDRTSITREKIVSRDHVPALIGKKGFNIRGIQENSNTLITFRQETLENGDRVALIKGLPEDVTIAESLIEKFIKEQPFILTSTMYVPQSSVGRIIGRGGDSIRSIQDVSRAKVNIDTKNTVRDKESSARVVAITLRGTEEQINMARGMITEKVEEEQQLRRNVELSMGNREKRGGNGGSKGPQLPGLMKEMEVFVSCAYHPNEFYLQVHSRDASIELDKLTEAMTDVYSKMGYEDGQWSPGDIVAAPFDVDGKMYRARIIALPQDDETQVEVTYVDYGDRRTIEKENLRKMLPEFLKLRFQGVRATLNLGHSGPRWSDQAIADFCDLTYCAQWRAVSARVISYMKDAMIVELFSGDMNIGEELIKKGHATSLSHNNGTNKEDEEKPSQSHTSTSSNNSSCSSSSVSNNTNNGN